MPTPFYHLSLAHEILPHPGLAQGVREGLQEHAACFLFGKTAPDVQVVSGRRREATHFFNIPPDRETPAWRQLLEAHPDLSDAAGLAAEQAVFLAGYFCHLQADEAWLADIFMPFFGPEAVWDDFRRRLFLHNALRAYLDRQVLESLPSGTGESLQGCTPGEWLPFAPAGELREWRDYLAGQLLPGTRVLTEEVFAGRQGIDPQEITQLVESEERMQSEIFDHLPQQRLVEFRERVVAENLELLQMYLSAT